MMPMTKMKKKVKQMHNLFKPFAAVFKAIYYIIDKVIVLPISRFIYRISELSRNNAGRIEKILNRPNILVYVSLFCAILIFIMIDVKAVNLVTQEAEILPGQPIKVIYNEEAYVIEGIPESVDITLIGRKSDIYLAKQLGDHQVILDLKEYSEGTYKVKFKYNHNVDTVKFKLDPSTITVKISEKISVNKTLDYELLNKDKLDAKLNVSRVELDRNTVLVKGSAEALEAVASVKALIDLKAANLTERGSHPVGKIVLVAYDNSGTRINNVEIVPDKIAAIVVVDSYYKELPVKVVTTGKLATGYAIKEAPSSLLKVTVYGDQEIIKDLTYVEALIDVEGLSTNKTFNITLTKPAGVRYMSDTTTSIPMVLGKEEQQRFTGVQVTFKNLGDSYTAGSVTTEDRIINVIAKGVNSVLKDFDSKLIKAEVDLNGLTAGVHDVPVSVWCDDFRLQLQSEVITVKIKLTLNSS